MVSQGKKVDCQKNQCTVREWKVVFDLVQHGNDWGNLQRSVGRVVCFWEGEAHPRQTSLCHTNNPSEGAILGARR